MSKGYFKNEFNRAKLLLPITVMVTFTLLNIINGNNWVGYLFSLVIFPLITWGMIEIMFKIKRKEI